MKRRLFFILAMMLFYLQVSPIKAQSLSGSRLLEDMESFLISLKHRSAKLWQGKPENLLSLLPEIDTKNRDIEVHELSSRIYSPAWNLVVQGDLSRSLDNNEMGGMLDFAIPLGVGGHWEKLYKRKWEISVSRLLNAAPSPKDYGPILRCIRNIYAMLVSQKLELIGEKILFLKKSINLLKTLSVNDLFYKAIYERLIEDKALEAEKKYIFKGVYYKKYKIMPLLFVDIDKLEELMKDREINLKKNIENAIIVDREGGILRFLDADIYARYRFNSKGSSERGLLFGMRIKFPIPIKSRERNEVSYLKLLSLKEMVQRVFEERKMEIMDRVWDINRCAEFILQHLTIMQRSLYRVQKNLALWKLGGENINYIELIENFLDAYYRLEVIDIYQERAYRDLIELYLLLQPIKAREFIKLLRCSRK